MNSVRLFLLMVTLILLVSCNHNLKVSDSKQNVVQSGTSYSYIVVRVEYIEQLKQICTDANPLRIFEDATLQKQAVATCVLSNLNIFNINAGHAMNFLDQYCGNNSDLSRMDDQQKHDAESACRAFGYGKDSP